MRVGLRLIHHGAGGEAAAERDEHHLVTALNASAFVGVGKGHGHACGRRVAGMGDGELEQVEGAVELFRRVLDDALVGLVGDDAGHVVEREVRAVERGADGRGHGLGGELEHFGAVHAQHLAWFAVGNGFADGKLLVDAREARIARSRRIEGDAARVEGLRGLVGGGAGEGVRFVVLVRDEAAQNAGTLVAPLEHGCARAISEQDAGVAVGPVGEAGEALGSHDERAAHGVASCGAGDRGSRGGHHRLGHRKAVDEARARRVQVEGDGVGEAQAAAQEARFGRGDDVGRDGGADDKVDLAGVEASLGMTAVDPAEGLAGCDLGEIGVRLIDGDASGLDARARADPLVVRVDERFELVVLDLQRREAFSASDDRAAHVAPSRKCLDSQTKSIIAPPVR